MKKFSPKKIARLAVFGRLSSAYYSRPYTTTLILCALSLLAVWGCCFFSGYVIAYDYQTITYPWYVDAIRAARFNPLSLYDPFIDAGQPTFHLFAFNDPIMWIPYIFPGLPGYTSLQILELGHLILIPIGLLLVARANQVPKKHLVFIVPLSVIGYACGPILKYQQQSSGLVSYSFVFALLGCLEMFRVTSKTRYAVMAGLCSAFIFEQFIYTAIFLPILLFGYGIANVRSLTKGGNTLRLLLGLVVAGITVAPGLLISLKFDHTIEVARDLQQLDEIMPLQVFGFFGAPSISIGLIVVPTALCVLILLGFSNLASTQRVLYALSTTVLGIYSLSNQTPFASYFRIAYPVASLIRRPYATWYVLLPFLFMVAVIGLRSLSVFSVRVYAALLAFVLIAGAFVGGQPILATVCLILILGVLLRPSLSTVVAAAFIQWILIDLIPFWGSPWHPNRIDPQGLYLEPYREIRQYLGGPHRSSLDVFRIANIGLPAEFGPSAGMYRFYNTAGDYNTFIPHNLVREVGTDQLHATKLPGFFETHPDALGSPGWERLAVKYYICTPDIVLALDATLKKSNHLKVLPTKGYWKVIEDSSALPFVTGLTSAGTATPLDAKMTRDSFELVVPKGIDEVRIAQNYDSWWHGYDRIDGHSLKMRNESGQLAIDTTNLQGEKIFVIYTDVTTRIAIMVSLLLQICLMCVVLVVGIRRSLRLTSAR